MRKLIPLVLVNLSPLDQAPPEGREDQEDPGVQRTDVNAQMQYMTTIRKTVGRLVGLIYQPLKL